MDILGLVILVGLALFFGWLTTRAWRIKGVVLRWLACIPVAILTIAALGLAGAALNGYTKFNAVRSNPVAPLNVERSSARVERGRVIARTCAGCHAANGDFPLSGHDFASSGPPLGTLWSPPLTASHFAEWSDGEIARAIREGVHKSGRSLLIMPAGAFRSMSDDDLHALIAFLREHNPEVAETPPTRLSLLGALLMNVASFQTAQEPLAGPVTAPPPGPTAAYGNYLLTVSGCRDCHASNLAGTPPSDNGPPPGPNLTSVGDRYSEAQLIRLLREGIKADATPLGEAMAYRDYELYEDNDFRAIYAYLQSIEPLPDNK